MILTQMLWTIILGDRGALVWMKLLLGLLGCIAHSVHGLSPENAQASETPNLPAPEKLIGIGVKVSPETRLRYEMARVLNNTLAPLNFSTIRSTINSHIKNSNISVRVGPYRRNETRTAVDQRSGRFQADQPAGQSLEPDMQPMEAILVPQVIAEPRYEPSPADTAYPDKPHRQTVQENAIASGQDFSPYFHGTFAPIPTADVWVPRPTGIPRSSVSTNIKCRGRTGYVADLEHNCQTFFNCLPDGSFDKLSCPAGLMFDQDTLSCQKASGVVCSAENLFDCTGKTGFYADPFSSDRASYFFCINGEKSHFRCPEGLFFNENCGACDLPQNCGPVTPASLVLSGPAFSRTNALQASSSNKNLATNQPIPARNAAVDPSHGPNPAKNELLPSVVDQSPAVPMGRSQDPLNSINSDFDCSGRYGLFADISSGCTSYWVCMPNGVKHLLQCPAHLRFNELLGACDWPERVSCSSLMVGSGFCADKIGFYPDPTSSCKSYYFCSAEGRTYNFTCPGVLLYNEVNGACDDPQNVQCLTARVMDGFDCEGKMGLFADVAQGCRVYYSCNAYGKKTRLQCPQGQMFNERSGLCDIDRNVLCGPDGSTTALDFGNSLDARDFTPFVQTTAFQPNFQTPPTITLLGSMQNNIAQNEALAFTDMRDGPVMNGASGGNFFQHPQGSNFPLPQNGQGNFGGNDGPHPNQFILDNFGQQTQMQNQNQQRPNFDMMQNQQRPAFDQVQQNQPRPMFDQAQPFFLDGQDRPIHQNPNDGGSVIPLQGPPVQVSNGRVEESSVTVNRQPSPFFPNPAQQQNPTPQNGHGNQNQQTAGGREQLFFNNRGPFQNPSPEGNNLSPQTPSFNQQGPLQPNIFSSQGSQLNQNNLQQPLPQIPQQQNAGFQQQLQPGNVGLPPQNPSLPQQNSGLTQQNPVLTQHSSVIQVHQQIPNSAPVPNGQNFQRPLPAGTPLLQGSLGDSSPFLAQRNPLFGLNPDQNQQSRPNFESGLSPNQGLQQSIPNNHIPISSNNNFNFQQVQTASANVPVRPQFSQSDIQAELAQHGDRQGRVEDFSPNFQSNLGLAQPNLLAAQNPGDFANPEINMIPNRLLGQSNPEYVRPNTELQPQSVDTLTGRQQSYGAGVAQPNTAVGYASQQGTSVSGQGYGPQSGSPSGGYAASSSGSGYSSSGTNEYGNVGGYGQSGGPSYGAGESHGHGSQDGYGGNQQSYPVANPQTNTGMSYENTAQINGNGYETYGSLQPQKPVIQTGGGYFASIPAGGTYNAGEYGSNQLGGVGQQSGAGYGSAQTGQQNGAGYGAVQSGGVGAGGYGGGASAGNGYMANTAQGDFDCRGHIGYYPDVNEDCRVYYYCKADGSKFQFRCPADLKYNATIGVCDWPRNVQCALQRVGPGNTPTWNESPFFDCQGRMGFFGDSAREYRVFYYCEKDGRKHRFVCPSNLRFNDARAACDWPENIFRGPYGGEQEFDCSGKRGYFGNPNTPSVYYFCEPDGTARKFVCSDRLVFNFQIGSCDWPERLNTMDGNPQYRSDLPGDTIQGKAAAIGISIKPLDAQESQLQQSLLKSPLKAPFKCVPGKYGFFADVTSSCQKYFYCRVDGKNFSFACPNNLRFNEKLGACDLERNVPCLTSGSPGFAQLAVQKTFFDCKGKTGLLPDFDEKCRTFFNCEPDGSFVTFACSDGLLFNSVIGACDRANTTQCKSKNGTDSFYRRKSRM